MPKPNLARMQRKIIAPIVFSMGSPKSRVEILRVGVIQDRKDEFTMEMLQDYVTNFQNKVYNGSPELPVNFNHAIGTEAAGWIEALEIEDSSLYATVRWTELGIAAIKREEYKFVSVEVWEKVPHWKSGKDVNNVISGLALTNDPALGGQKPLQLSNILNSQNMSFEKMLKELSGKESISKSEYSALLNAHGQLSPEQKLKYQSEMEAIALSVEGDGENQEAEKDEGTPPEAEGEKKEEKKDGEEEKNEGESKEEEEKEEKSEEEDSSAEGEQKELAAKHLLARIQKLESENKELRAERKQENCQKLATKFILSKEVSVGVIPKKKDAMVQFLSTLSKSQVEMFQDLFANIKYLNSEHIEVQKEQADAATKEASAQKLAREMAKSEGIPLHIALEKAYEEMGMLQ